MLLLVSIELIFLAVYLQNVNQGQYLAINSNILSATMRVGLSAASHVYVILC